MSHLFLVCRHELLGKWTELLKSAKFYSRKGRADLCLLLLSKRKEKTSIKILVFSLVGTSPLGIIVYRTQAMRKPINYFVTNMAMSDLLYSIFLFPRNTALLYTERSWLVGGGFGQALCKFSPWSFPIRHVHHCFRSESDSDSSGSIWRCVISPPFSTHHAKTVSLLHSRHMGYCHGLSLTIFICPQTGRIPREANL